MPEPRGADLVPSSLPRYVRQVTLHPWPPWDHLSPRETSVDAEITASPSLGTSCLWLPRTPPHSLVSRMPSS